MRHPQLREVIRHLQRLARPQGGGGVTDGHLLEHFLRHRDEAAFELLLWRHGPMVLGVCQRLLGNPLDAEDAFQATFLVLVRKAHTITQHASVGSWLYRVAYRLALRVRASTPPPARLPAEEVPAVEPTPAWEVRELRQLLDAELNRLPEKYRTPLVLCYLEGKTRKEAARQLGWAEGTLSSRLARGQERLRKRLLERGLTLAAGTLSTALSPHVAVGAMPPPLVTATIQTALVSTTAKGTAAGVITLRAVTLAEELLRGMVLAKAKLVAAVLLAVGLVTGSAGVLTHRTLIAQPPEERQTPRSTVMANRMDPPKPDEERPARTDVDGAPRPPGATARPIAEEREGNDAQTARDEPQTRIVGVVVDEGGQPVAGARVNVTWRRKAPEDIQTAADGSFSLPIGFPTRRAEIVHASAEGGARQGLARFEQSFASASLPVRVVLKPARTIRVRVTDATGSPVEGAAVQEVPLAGFGSLAHTVTDARGLAQLRLPADADVVNLIALKPGLGFDVFEKYQSWPPLGVPAAYPDEVSLILDGPRRIEIKAVDAAGRPVAGVPFVPLILHKRGKLGHANLGGNDIAVAITDAGGIARFDWIPKRIEEPIPFTCPSFEYHSVYSPTIHPSEADATVTVRVLRNTRVAGRIFLPDGASAAGVLVHAWGIASSGNREPFFTRTADDGSYAMRLAPDSVYTVTCLDPRGATPPRNGVSVREGVAQEGLDLRLTEGALLRGRVTRGPEGRPAAREQVNIELTEARPMYLWAMTDDDGRYTVRLAPGKYTLSAGSPPTRAEVHITGQEEIVRDLAVTGETRRPRPSMTLAGVVVERTGAGRRPVAGAELREVLTRTTGFPPTKAVADGQGRFVLTVGMRPQLLYARSPDGTLAGYVEVAATGEVEIPVSAAATVLGRVVDRDGRPVPARRISLWMMGGAGAFEHRFLDWPFYTDETGAFLFSGLVPGSEGHIGVPHSNDFRDARKPEVREFKVPGPEPIILQNIMVPTEPPAK